MRLQPLAWLEQIWGRSGGILGGSLSQINAQVGLGSLSSSGEDRERQYFSGILRDAHYNREHIRHDATVDKAIVKKNLGHLTHEFAKYHLIG